MMYFLRLSFSVICRDECQSRPLLGVDDIEQRPVEDVGAGIVELGGDRAEHRQRLIGNVEEIAVAAVLLAHVAQGILGPFALELVDGDHIGEIEHVDLFQLGRGAEFAGHDVQRNIADPDHPGIPLADAAGLDEDQVETGRPHHVDGILNGGRKFGLGVAGGQRTHVDPVRIDRIHPDPVAQQRTAGPLA